jgi:hypothetical protein
MGWRALLRLFPFIGLSPGCLADAPRAAGVFGEDSLLYVCSAGICTDFLPPVTVACPTDTIIGLTDCAEANYRAALASDFGLLSEARVTVEGGGATVVLQWSAQRHSPYSAVLALAPASSYPRYWVTTQPPSSMISRLYPGAGPTVSPQYASAEAACTSGFAYLIAHHAVGTSSGEHAIYDHGLCVLRMGTASVGFLPIHSFPLRPSAADAADRGYGGDPLLK